MKIYNRRYLGAKTKLLDFIEEIVNENCIEKSSFVDLFAGTGTVADHFNKKDTKIIVNDLLKSNYLSYITWLSNEDYDEKKVKEIILELNSISYDGISENYFSKNFSNNYFSIENAYLIGAIRDKIETYNGKISNREKAILITSLIYAADKIANTFGHYEAYRKKLDDHNKLNLVMPTINNDINVGNEIYNEDSNKLVKKISADIFYLDPPYNSRQYSDAYHLLENIATWKKPEVFGVAKKMNDRKDTKSEYCKIKANVFFDELISNIKGKYILVSYNNMGEKGAGRSQSKLSDKDIISSLEKRGDVKIFEKDFKYFTTGKTEIENHKERIFLCLVKN